MEHNNHYYTIMAGGVGSRFWPESTEEKPKQFLDILGVGKSLLQMTYERFRKIAQPQQILVITNKQYLKEVRQHIPEIPERNILCEPSRNNTAPCVAYTMLRLLSENPEAAFVTAPSDHIITKEEEFLSKIQQAFKVVEQTGGIVTLGIKPTRPDTGYGYIEFGAEKFTAHRVNRFKGKPNLQTAEAYLEAGNYLWNAGIFVWKAADLKKIFKINAPEILEVLCEDESMIGSLQEQVYIDRVYPNTTKISVDYAILEQAKNIFVIPADIGWSDLGTWKSLYEFLEKDRNNNHISADKAVIEDVKNSFVKVKATKEVIIKGLDDYIVVDSETALLIYPKYAEQEIKERVERLTKQ